MATQTTEQFLEQFLFKQLNEIAPGKYVLAPFLERVKATLRNPECRHLKGGRLGTTFGKDYNLSFFTYVTGVSEIKCLYGCGLKLRSDESDKNAWDELYGLFQSSTNTKASTERTGLVSSTRGSLPRDPGPVPTYTDADRARIQEREAGFWAWAKANPEEYKKQYGNISQNHPDPIEAPESIIPRLMSRLQRSGQNTVKLKSQPRPTTQDAFEALRASHMASKSKPKVVFQDEGVPALEPVKKIRKTRKTQSRKSRKK